MRSARMLTAAALAASITLALGGCAAGGGDAAPGSGAEPATSSLPGLSGELTIYAAASLKAAFDELAVQFEVQNPSLEVLPIVYDGSSTLATQIIEGAPVDVFASADEANMAKVTDVDLAQGQPELFATNTLVVATPAGNPGEVDDLADLSGDGVTVVLCAVEVPCGAASQKLLAAAGVTVTPASFEQNVTAVLTKVAADEADAGLVYATDVVGQSEVESFVPAGAEDAVNRYPIASLRASDNADAAAAFVAFVAGPEGRAVLDEWGFGAP